MALGQHKIEYEVIEGWEQMPEGWSFVEVAGVACDSRDRVYVFNRGEHPIIVFDKEGRFLTAWGEPLLFGPGSIHAAHTADEFVPVNELRAAVEQYATIARALGWG